MKVLYGIKNIKRMPAPVVAIGVFDGLHKGHKRVIRVVEKRASKIGGTACVVTFDPHPVKVLRPEQGPPRISSLGHRLRMLEEGGVDLAVVIKFSASFARMKPAEFIENVLIKRLGARELIVGENFHFGKRRSGRTAELKRLSEKHGFSIKTVPMVKGSGKDISSTRIRRLIVSGDLGRASRLLG